MAFIKTPASVGERQEDLLSADNGFPERHVVMDTLRRAARQLGLKAPVLATLDAMLSCLPPKRRHNTVFASNATLTFRRNGISDRTIRRHVAILQEHGLLIRRDSANGKRFARHSAAQGATLRFGFDLTPLFERLSELADLARHAAQELEQIAYLKTAIRARANARLQVDPDDAVSVDALRCLRRNLTVEEFQILLDDLSGDEMLAQPCERNDAPGLEMSGSDGQNVRHHHRSTKEHIDGYAADTADQPPVSIAELLDACPEAAEFALSPVRTMQQAVSHARTLAPMLGIDDRTYADAQRSLGAEGTALTIWAIMQFHRRLRTVGAYFRSITSGRHSRGFDPRRLIRSLAQGRTPGTVIA